MQVGVTLFPKAPPGASGVCEDSFTMTTMTLHVVVVSSGHFHRLQSLQLECLDLGSDETNVPMFGTGDSSSLECHRSKDVSLLRSVFGVDFVRRYAEISALTCLTCLWEAADSIAATSSVADREIQRRGIFFGIFFLLFFCLGSCWLRGFCGFYGPGSWWLLVAPVAPAGFWGFCGFCGFHGFYGFYGSWLLWLIYHLSINLSVKHVHQVHVVH